MAETNLIYGQTGSFKTQNVGFFARYVYEVTGRRTRYVGTDGGGCKPIQPEIDAGIIEPFFVRAGKGGAFPLVILRKLAEGYWGDEMEDGVWVGQLLVPTGIEMENIGAYAWEGLTSTSDLVMADLRDKNRTTAQETVTPFSETVGGATEKFGSNSKGHYGFCQREVLKLMGRFGALPVSRVLFTAHEAKGEDEDTKAPIRGPALAGQAATGKVPVEVGGCIHFEQETYIVEEEKEGKKLPIAKTKVRAYFISHPDPLWPKILYPCKARVPSARLEELLERFPGGYFIPTLTSGLDGFLKVEDELSMEFAGELEEWKRGIDEQRSKAA